jgi:hypothetical protein
VKALGIIGLMFGGLLFLAGSAAGSDLPAQVTPTPTPSGTPRPTPIVTARPELTLQLRDLPPGYEENTPLAITFRGTPLEDHRLRRAGPGAGPYSVWSAVFEPGVAVTQDDVEAFARELATLFSRSLAPTIEATDWEPLDPEGLGEHGAVYSFSTLEPEDNFPGDGAFAVFTRNGLIVYLRLLSADGGAVTDLRRFARFMDDRIQRTVTPPQEPNRQSTP